MPEQKNPRGAGRKPLYNEPTNCYTIRLTESQREKLDKLGGWEWVRARIEEARS